LFWEEKIKYFSLILFFFSAENDYSTAFYVSDAFFLVALLVSLTVRVTSSSKEPKNSGKHQKKENRKAIKQLFSPSALIFFAMIFQGGLMWGIKDTYFFVYLQGDIS
jgi:sugar phosphate permease